MKKLAAMLLALVLLAASLPALGEDVSGMWYITLADVTLGYFRLDADGTVEAQVPGQEPVSGTWTAEEDRVTVTIEGAPMEFVWDGVSLTSAGFPLPVIREEGRLDMDTVAKIINGEEYELPEGMTQEDITQIANNFLAEYQRIIAGASAAEGTGPVEESAGPADTEPADEAKLTILQENFRVVPSFSGFSGVYIAKVKNDTEAPFFIIDGSMQLTDKDGNVAGEVRYLYPTGSRYLEPGETSFISFQADLAEDVAVDVATNIEVRSESYYNTDKALTVESASFVKGKSEYDYDTVRATVVNDSDEPLPDVQVVMVLEDAEGNLLFMDTESLYLHELGPHSSITLVGSVDNRLRDYLAANGIEPVAVEAFAWVENKD